MGALKKIYSSTQNYCFHFCRFQIFKFAVGVLPVISGYLDHVISIVDCTHHYSNVIISAMASQITVVFSVYSTVCSGADQEKHQSSASLAFVRGIHRGAVNSPHKWPVTRKKNSICPFDDVIMLCNMPGMPYIVLCWNALCWYYGAS